MKCRAAVLCKCLKTEPATPALSSEDTHRDWCCSAAVSAATPHLRKAPCSEALACSLGAGHSWVSQLHPMLAGSALSEAHLLLSSPICVLDLEAPRFVFRLTLRPEHLVLPSNADVV